MTSLEHSDAALISKPAAQVETLLKTQEPQGIEEEMPNAPEPVMTNGVSDSSTFISTNEGINFAIGDRDPSISGFDPTQAFSDLNNMGEVPDMLSWNTDIGVDPMSWEMIGLGLDEPLPAQEIIDDL
jgi:hypothetical protein